LKTGAAARQKSREEALRQRSRIGASLADLELTRRIFEHVFVDERLDLGLGQAEPFASDLARVLAEPWRLLLDPFTRLEGAESTPGAGLGLAIVREIAVGHGGTVDVHDPVEGQGVVVEIVIPIGQVPSASLESAS
jgi:hypothetical protein